MSDKKFPDLKTIHMRGIVPSYTWSPGWPHEHAQQHGSDFSYDHVEGGRRAGGALHRSPLQSNNNPPETEARSASRIGRLSDDERREMIAGLEQLRDDVRRRYTILPV
jgi:hypothetical protein